MFWKKPPSIDDIPTSKSPSPGIFSESAKHPVNGADNISNTSKLATPVRSILFGTTASC